MIRKNNLFMNLLVYILVIASILLLGVLVIWSFAEKWPWPLIWPQEFSLKGWSYFLNPVNGAWKALGVSFLISTGVTILALLVSIPAGRALGMYQFKGKKIINLLVLAPIIVPPLAVTMGIHINFIRYGLADTITGVILVHLIPTIPYSIRILTSVFMALGSRIEAQARVLGAKPWQIFIYITLPLIKPGIFSAGILVFIISFSQYILTFLIGGGQVVTFPMVLFPLVNNGDRTLASVYSWVFIIAGLLFTLIMEKMLKNDKERTTHFYL